MYLIYGAQPTDSHVLSALVGLEFEMQNRDEY